jgi:hypothetical protein
VGKEKEFQLPADLTALSDADLAQLESDATAEFNGAAEAKDVARVGLLADSIESVRGESQRRASAAAEVDLEIQRQRERVTPPQPVAEPVAPAAVAPALPAAIQPAVVTTPLSTVAPANSAVETLLAGGPMPQANRKLNPTLAEIQANAPSTKAPASRRESVLVASANIPGVTHASTLPDMDALVAAMTAKAKTLSITRLGDDAPWYPVASMQLDHRYSLDLGASPEQINEVLQASANPDALVAAGGWCSPSEISYDFYNVVCEDGMLDLPSVGINRGGMRWPTSASFADIISGNNYWSWNETQDIAALTGTAQSGTKTCVRVPCPAFNEQRLHCDGLCLTVGNLMEDAYPELIANHTRLLFAGYAHRMNLLRINALLDPTNSTAITGFGTAGSGVVAPVLGSLELSAIDYRERFAMCEDAVLEVVLPRWLRGAMRSDLRKRTGVDLLEVSDARLMNMFDLLNIRVQWVTDWQSRTSGYPGYASAFLTTWPTTVQFLMFAAGTFVWGRGLQLNLGVIRDSVLNATNDHTAEWMEECWLIAKIGHESRLGTIAICPDGTTGAADLTACGV